MLAHAKHALLNVCSEDRASESSESSDDERDASPHKKNAAPVTVALADDDDDEEGGSGATTAAAARTQNEVVEVDFNVPDVDEVGESEALERVGEVMSVSGNVVIVRGGAVQAQIALDADTLLVFEDRKVLGYVRGPADWIRGIYLISHRCTRRLVRPCSPSTKYASVRSIPLMQRRYRCRAPFSTSRAVAAS